MKKNIIIFLISVLCLCCFVGCSKYMSHYSAIASVRTNSPGKGYLGFSSFQGTMVFSLKCKDGSARQMDYTAKLEDGSASVYYDCDGTKKLLFTIGSGESVSSSLEGLPVGKLYVIVETDGKCKEGRFDFEMK